MLYSVLSVSYLLIVENSGTSRDTNVTAVTCRSQPHRTVALPNAATARKGNNIYSRQNAAT